MITSFVRGRAGASDRRQPGASPASPVNTSYLVSRISYLVSRISYLVSRARARARARIRARISRAYLARVPLPTEPVSLPNVARHVIEHHIHDHSRDRDVQPNRERHACDSGMGVEAAAQREIERSHDERDHEGGEDHV